MALNVVIANYSRTPVYKNLLGAYSVVGDPCDGSSDGDSEAIDFDQMAGLFMLLDITMGVALLVAIVGRIVFRRQRELQGVSVSTRHATDAIVDNMPATEGEMLRELLKYARKEQQEAARAAAQQDALLADAAPAAVRRPAREVVSMTAV